MTNFFWGFTVAVFLCMFAFLIMSATCDRAPDYATRVGKHGWIDRHSATGWTDTRPLRCRLY